MSLRQSLPLPNADGFSWSSSKRSRVKNLLASATLVEIFVSPHDAGAVGLALAHLKPEGRVLWVQDRMTQLETGLPAAPAFSRFGNVGNRLVLTSAKTARDTLWSIEEGLRCGALGGIIGEIWGAPSSLDFTATKRLALRAERQKVPVFLIRLAGTPALSAARERWQIASLPSAPHRYDPDAPGAPRWRAELFRSRGRRPGTWEVEYDRQTHCFDLVSPLRNPEMETPANGYHADRHDMPYRARA